MKNKKIVICFVSVALAFALMIGGCALYVSDYYRADMGAIAAFSEGISVKKTVDDGFISYGETDAAVGFIFYPGGKVEHTAYEPLMLELASRGVFCVLVEMPLRLAVLDMNAASGVLESFSEVGRWYIGGHSLGGSMAASYATKHAEAFDGIVLLGAYSTADLSHTSLDVLSVFGSEDGVMNRQKYDEYKTNLPADLVETVIEGGCHAWFGMYGAQDGDGTPTVSAEAQIRASADNIAKFMLQGES